MKMIVGVKDTSKLQRPGTYVCFIGCKKIFPAPVYFGGFDLNRPLHNS